MKSGQRGADASERSDRSSGAGAGVAPKRRR